MVEKRKVKVDYGYTQLEIDVPETSMILENPPRQKVLPPLKDPSSACKEALENPIGMERISDLAKKGSKVTIAINDLFGPSGIVAPLVLDELHKSGVSDTDITFMSAGGTWWKLARREFLKSVFPCQLLPPEIVDKFWPPGTAYPRGIRCHDAADPKELVFLGYTNLGDFVEYNKAVTESDLLVYIGWGAYPVGVWGGYGGAGVVVGLGSARSIGSHHTLDVCGHRDSAHGDPRKHLYRRHKEAIMDHIEKTTGKQVFYVDGTPNIFGEWAAFHAGHWKKIQELEWAVSDREKTVSIERQADVVIEGCPEVGTYDSTRNPIASMAEAVTQMKCWVGSKPPLKEGGVLIHVTPVDGTISERRPSDKEVLDLYGKLGFRAEELYDYEDEFYTRPDYLYKYTHCHTFHPIHPFWLIYAYAQYAREYTSKTIAVGAGNPDAASSIGYTPVRNFDEAWKMAEQIVGKDPDVLVLPGKGKRVMKLVLKVQ